MVGVAIVGVGFKIVGVAVGVFVGEVVGLAMTVRVAFAVSPLDVAVMFQVPAFSDVYAFEFQVPPAPLVILYVAVLFQLLPTVS